jgi:hypothetical protein
MSLWEGITKDFVVDLIDKRGRQYAAVSFVGKDVDDLEHSAFGIAGRTITEAVSPKHPGLDLILPQMIRINLMKGYMELDLPSRVERIEAMLTG